MTESHEGVQHEGLEPGRGPFPSPEIFLDISSLKSSVLVHFESHFNAANKGAVATPLGSENTREGNVQPQINSHLDVF